jgi:acyl-CoA thioesterase FadM
MNLILRLLLLLLGASRRSRLNVTDTSTLDLRVWPNDLDVQMHMNNGRFASVMDLGRIDLLVRSGFWREARRRGWYPLVGAIAIEYRRPLRVFQRYRLTTRILGWDERWFYIEQRFIRDGRVVAIATVKAIIRGAAGVVPSAEALEAIGAVGESPPLSEQIAARVGARPSDDALDPRP